MQALSSLDPLAEQAQKRAQERLFSNVGMATLGKREPMRATSHSLVDNLHVQLEREKQQKKDLIQHLKRLEDEQRETISSSRQ